MSLGTSGATLRKLPHTPWIWSFIGVTAVWLATLPDDGPTGGFFRNREPIPW